MSNYRKHIDQFFREKLGNYRETPPPEAWQELEARLDGLAPVPPGTSYRWLWHVAIVSVIVFLGVSVGRKMLNTPGNETATALNSTTNVASAAATVENATTAAETTPAAAPSNMDKGSTPNNDNDPSTALAPAVAANGTAANEDADDNKEQEQDKENRPKQNSYSNAQYLAGISKQRMAKRSEMASANDNDEEDNSSLTSNAKGNTANPAPEETNEVQEPNASPNTTLAVVDKPEVPDQNGNNAKSDKPNPGTANKNQSKHSFPRLESGVKLGFEGGVSGDAARKFVVSPYLQFNLSPKLSVMTQPAFKVSNLPNKNIGAPQSYYETNEDGKVTKAITPVTAIVGIGQLDTVCYSTVYTFSQTHDSIVKTNKIGGTSMEFEIPIMMKYNLTKKLSVYGGVNIVYRQYTGITENTYRAKGLFNSYSITDTTTLMPTADDQPAMGLVYGGQPYANYGGPLKATQSGSQVSVGYMIGFSYAYHKKWLFDALVQQSPARPDVINGIDINKSLSVPYFRLSVGYKLTK